MVQPLDLQYQQGMILPSIDWICVACAMLDEVPPVAVKTEQICPHKCAESKAKVKVLQDKSGTALGKFNLRKWIRTNGSWSWHIPSLSQLPLGHQSLDFPSWHWWVSHGDVRYKFKSNKKAKYPIELVFHSFWIFQNKFNNRYVFQLPCSRSLVKFYLEDYLRNGGAVWLVWIKKIQLIKTCIFYGVTPNLQ